MRSITSLVGWTQISRSDVNKATEILRGGERGIRDEIGFLALHQGFADRFFPGTSVLQTRLRYVLFVPWQINDIVSRNRSDISRSRAGLKESERRLVARLVLGATGRDEQTLGIIGSRSTNYDAAQPPSTIYWTALRKWKILQPLPSGRTPSRDYVLGGGAAAGDNDQDNDEPVSPALNSAFYALPSPPKDWGTRNRTSEPLHFGLERAERDYLRKQLCSTNREGPNRSSDESLLARLAATKASDTPWRQLPFNNPLLPRAADSADAAALKVAVHASSLTKIGRAAYSALVEHVAHQEDGHGDTTQLRTLGDVIEQERSSALRCNLSDVEAAIGHLDDKFNVALEATLHWLKHGHRRVEDLLPSYKASEVFRKPGRARLADYPASPSLRDAWLQDAKQRAPEGLSYRWHRVSQLLDDLNGRTT